MKAAFDVLIKDDFYKLTRSLGKTPIDMEYSEWNIPVNVTFPGGTTQVIEDTIVVECDHAGATLGDVDLGSLFYDPATGNVEEYDYTVRGLVCDKCEAWQDVDGEWHE